MTKLTRFQKARMRFRLRDINIRTRDKKDRVKCAYVSGSKAKAYFVILRRNGEHLTAECFLDTGAGDIPCLGNTQTVCYHSLAVIMESANERGYKVSVCRSEKDARNRANLGGEFMQVSPRDKGKSVWLVLEKKNDC